MPVLFNAVRATCGMRVKQDASPESTEQEALTLKLVVILAGLFAVAHQYPQAAQSAKRAVKVEMSHFFPEPR